MILDPMHFKQIWQEISNAQEEIEKGKLPLYLISQRHKILLYNCFPFPLANVFWEYKIWFFLIKRVMFLWK